jgi:hypothetical protein
MKIVKFNTILSVLLILILVQLACNFSAAQPVVISTFTNTPKTIATDTITPRPSFTLRPTDTPNLTATQAMADSRIATKAYFDQWDAATQKYYDLGYLSSTNGTKKKYPAFAEEWAQISWYRYWIYEEQVRNFYISAHFKWSSAFRNADPSGCGFAFAVQENGDKYSVFLDRKGVLFYIFEQSKGYYLPVGATRETGSVEFENPYDNPVEADFALIVTNSYAYILVNGDVVSEYTLSDNKFYKGGFGPAILSGTNKDFGTRCEMTNFRAWIQKD